MKPATSPVTPRSCAKMTPITPVRTIGRVSQMLIDLRDEYERRPPPRLARSDRAAAERPRHATYRVAGTPRAASRQVTPRIAGEQIAYAACLKARQRKLSRTHGGNHDALWPVVRRSHGDRAGGAWVRHLAVSPLGVDFMRNLRLLMRIALAVGCCWYGGTDCPAARIGAGRDARAACVSPERGRGVSLTGRGTHRASARRDALHLRSCREHARMC